VTPREAGGLGLDAQWSDDFHHALFAVLNENERQGYYADFGTLEQLAKALERTFVYDGIYSRYRDRVHGRPADALSQHRFLGYIQTHDQVGNRAVGDRISHTSGLERAKIAAALYLLSPFIPMLFQGEEWAASTPFLYFADHNDPELARAVSEGRRKEFSAFGWDPASIPDPEGRSTFNASKLRWDEATVGSHAEMLEWYRALIQFRRGTASLNDGTAGNLHATFDEQAKWLRMERGDVTVICNFGDREQVFAVSDASRVVIRSHSATQICEGKLVVPPVSVVVVSEGPSRNA
jgi:maltooligosyltrehalose trehalohydrolase